MWMLQECKSDFYNIIMLYWKQKSNKKVVQEECWGKMSTQLYITGSNSMTYQQQFLKK